MVALLSGCAEVDGPATSERCQGFIQADAESRAAWERARDSAGSEAQIRRLRRTFIARHHALFASGCLVSCSIRAEADRSPASQQVRYAMLPGLSDLSVARDARGTAPFPPGSPTWRGRSPRGRRR